MSNPGGFLEHASSTATRPPRAGWPAALPVSGPFQFEAPYSTIGVRLTAAPADVIEPVGYSYWRNINHHVGRDHLFVFAVSARSRGGPGPSLYRVDKATDAVTPLGPLFEDTHPLSWATGEGWYWSATDPDVLVVNDTRTLWHYHVDRRELVPVYAHPNLDEYLWQPHSSADDSVHSVTVRRASDYAMLGAGVIAPGPRYRFFPAQGQFDECQVDQSGRWLLIKDNVDQHYGEDNRIIDLSTGAERVILDEDGGLGHSDCGWGYAVGEDNWGALPNSVVVYAFAEGGIARRLVYHTPSWDAGLGHLSHTNAANAPLDRQIVVGGTATRAVAPRANEFVGFRLDGSLETLVIAPVMTDLAAAGGGDDYRKLPKGNLDPTGAYLCATMNAAGPTLDVYLIKVPTHLLSGGDSMPPPPEPERWGYSPAIQQPSPGVFVKVGGAEGVAEAATREPDLGRAGTVVRIVAPAPGQLVAVELGTSTPRYALRFQEGGWAEVWEQGQWVADTGYIAGDVFTIRLKQHRAVYGKQGSEFYRSRARRRPAWPLVLQVLLYSAGARLGPVTVDRT